MRKCPDTEWMFPVFREWIPHAPIWLAIRAMRNFRYAYDYAKLRELHRRAGVIDARRVD